jgi:DamX protein
VLDHSQEANYITVLDLKQDPFSPEPDSLFYYSFDSFEQRLVILNGLVEGTDLFVLVIGEPGSGKTTLLNRYLASTDAEWNSVRILADPEPAETPSLEPAEPEGYPAYILQDATDPIVIVDDAHQLPQKDLEYLIHEALVPGSKNKIKRLVLFGESELYTAVTKIAASLSAQPAVNKIYLPGLAEEQIVGYLKHRLTIAGYSGEFPFDDSEIKDLHQASGGYPGSINETVRQRLNEKFSSQKEGHNMLKNLSANPRKSVAWIAAGIIAILLAVFWFSSERKPPLQKGPDKKLTKTVFRKKIERKPEPAPQKEAPKIASAGTTAKPAPAVKSEPPTAAKSEVKSTAPPPNTAKSEMPPEEKKAPPEPVKTAALEKDKPSKPDLKQEAKPAKAKPAPVIAKSTERKIRREGWLLSQDGGSYTVQIIGVSNEESLQEFIKRNQLLEENEIAYYESTFKGKPWYQLLYGLYPTPQEARMAAKNLPENIRRTGPWIRSISAVQKAIKSRSAD